MAFARQFSWLSVALALGLALSVALAASAQGPRGVPEPYTPAKDATDLKAVLFNWMRNMGMLKGHDERDMVAMLEYQGAGTIQVDGEPCTLTKYRASTNYQTFSQRIQYACTRPNGQTYSNIEVVSGLYAWDEDTPGAEIGPTKGKATPMPATVQERLIRLWASPQGAPKAAVAGTTETFWLGANPGTLFADGVAKVGQTSVSWASGKPVLTFPIPGVPAATATATLDAKYMTERVVVTLGSATREFTYSDYQDWNNPLNKIEVFYAGKMVERRNSVAVRDLTTTRTETGNVYVVAPVLSQIVQTPGMIVVLHESPNSPHRSIYTDGRQLPKDISDLNPTWLGYSVGHWEQDTLVVNSAGFNDLGWLDVGGHPQTESLRITERLRRRDVGHLEYEMTIDDPKAFTKPFTLRADKTLVPDSVLLEDICDNERSGTHLVSGVKIAPEVLAKYAGTYEFGPGRQAVVTVSGEQLLIQDSAHPADRLFVARSETTFLSSVSMASVEFVKNAQGTVTQLIRREGAKTETGVRSAGR